MMDGGLFGLWAWPFMALGMIFAVIFIFIFVVLWVLALIDCAKRKFRNDVEKIVWIIVLVFGSWIGLVAYYLVIVLNNPKGLAKK